MTHDELLAKVNRNCENSGDVFAHALCAVVELHKPYESTDAGFLCAFCTDMKAVEHWYPCPTIQAIEKELG